MEPPRQKQDQGPTGPGPRRPQWPSAATFAAFTAVAALAFLLRDAELPAGAARLAVLGLGLALAGCLLAQAVSLSRVRARLRALTVEYEARCQAEDRARHSAELPEARLESVLRAASRISIIATDGEGLIRVFNSGAEHMLGYAAEEVVGRATPALIHLPAEVEAYGRELSARLGRPVQGFEVFVTLARQGGPKAFDAREWTYVRKDGRHVPVWLTVTGVYSPEGELTGFLGVGVDLTARKALEAEHTHSRQALLEAKEEAEASNRAKGQFLANMTHEVRTPLNGVLGMLQVLQTTKLEPDQRESVAVALEAAERLHQLLNNILDFARLDSPLAAAPDCLSFPPSDLLRALEAATAPKARAKGLSFTTAIEPDLPELMLSDPAGLRKCLEQLLDNAVKFSAKGEVRLAAGPARMPDGKPGVAFRVEDTGIGLPQDRIESLFEAFVQADAGTTRTFGGAGLGLAIADRLARRLGGAIEARNRTGGGTVMILTVLADCTPQPKA